MTRFGALMLLLFAVVIGGFLLLTKRSPSGGMPTARQQASPPASAGISGAPIIPVEGVTPDQLADTWGQARAEGAREHHAIDIMAPRGTPVLAAAAGTVEKLFESRGGGHTIYIRRTDPAWIDYYAHLDSYASDLREGVKVVQGQPIGTVGSSGDADPSAPHLHYEIKRMGRGETWWQGREVNPYPLLRAAPPPA